MDQNYIQRYHTAKNEKQAAKSVWMCVWMYVPASLLFFIIGAALFSWYQVHPEMMDVVNLKVAAERLRGAASRQKVQELAATVQPTHQIPSFRPNADVCIERPAIPRPCPLLGERRVGRAKREFCRVLRGVGSHSELCRVEACESAGMRRF